jgi:hypothetical protein
VQKLFGKQLQSPGMPGGHEGADNFDHPLLAKNTQTDARAGQPVLIVKCKNDR